jgi:hypothetical protein
LDPVVPIAANGDLADFPWMGYNADAITSAMATAATYTHFSVSVNTYPTQTGTTP